jgi:transposase
MARPQKDPLRTLAADERTALERLSRSRAAPAAEVIRAKELLAVAAGASYQDAARAAGRKSGDAVAQLVARFNRQGLAALGEPRHAGQPKRYTHLEQERILQEVRRQPDREQDGTASWSLTALQRAVRRAPDGLPAVSTYTIWHVLQEAGFRWGKDRTWCQTGTVVRKRRSGVVRVTDPDAVAKKS